MDPTCHTLTPFLFLFIFSLPYLLLQPFTGEHSRAEGEHSRAEGELLRHERAPTAARALRRDLPPAMDSNAGPRARSAAAHTCASSSSAAAAALTGERHERRERKIGAQRLRMGNFKGRSEPASGEYILPGAAPLLPLLI
jgi:hypothetical protein